MDANVYDVCAQVLDVARDRLADLGRPVARSYVAAGQMTWDDCCGTLGVLPERIFRSVQFPLEQTTWQGQCDASIITVDLVIFLVRCVPTLSTQGEAPSVDALDPAYHAFLEDAAAMWDVAVGPMPNTEWLTAGGSQVFTGDQGGCVAVETRFTIGVDTDVWP